MATLLKTTNPVIAGSINTAAADLETRVKQIPDIFAGLTAASLLSQVPAMQARAAAHKSATDGSLYVQQLKGVTRAYRRLVAELGSDDRLESSVVVPMLTKLAGVLATAETAGFDRQAIVSQADTLTQNLISAMAVVSLLVA
ncbi:MAG: hypothetical protein H7338_16760 [Candidatus Sericytochromatia bacterium]|nr:hypothetical protein [Candidatus Sericytochromatia bacterium]